MIGAAEKGNGVLRLLKAIRHDAPISRRRRSGCVKPGSASHGQVMKSIHASRR
jgi:elongation factor G